MISTIIISCIYFCSKDYLLFCFANRDKIISPIDQLHCFNCTRVPIVWSIQYLITMSYQPSQQCGVPFVPTSRGLFSPGYMSGNSGRRIRSARHATELHHGSGARGSDPMTTEPIQRSGQRRQRTPSPGRWLASGNISWTDCSNRSALSTGRWLTMHMPLHGWRMLRSKVYYHLLLNTSKTLRPPLIAGSLRAASA